MSIQERMNSIRKQPEHIRMRYVFLCVFVSMIFVVILWLLTLQKNLENISVDKTIQKSLNNADLRKAADDFQKQQSSFQESFENAKQQLQERSLPVQGNSADVTENNTVSGTGTPVPTAVPATTQSIY